jgi:hypothetical protein
VAKAEEDEEDEEEAVLLCDGCDAEVALSATNLKCVPAGDWFCPKCVKKGRAAAAKKAKKA